MRQPLVASAGGFWREHTWSREHVEGEFRCAARAAGRGVGRSVLRIDRGPRPARSPTGSPDRRRSGRSWPSALAADFAAGPPARCPVLLVTATGREAEAATAAIGDLIGDDNVALFPSWETLPHERLSPRADTVGRRLATLRRIAHPEAAPRRLPGRRRRHGPIDDPADGAASRRDGPGDAAGRRGARPFGPGRTAGVAGLHPGRHGREARRDRRPRRHSRHLPADRRTTRCGSSSSATRSPTSGRSASPTSGR